MRLLSNGWISNVVRNKNSKLFTREYFLLAFQMPGNRIGMGSNELISVDEHLDDKCANKSFNRLCHTAYASFDKTTLATHQKSD